MTYSLEDKYLREVEKAAKPLERRSTSKYNTPGKNLVRRRKAAWLLQFIDKGLIKRRKEYFGLPGDSFLMENIMVDLGLFSKGDMFLIDKDACYSVPHGFLVRKMKVEDCSSKLQRFEEGSIYGLNYSDVDVCNCMSTYSNINPWGNLVDMCSGITRWSDLISITVQAARERSGISGLKSFINCAKKQKLHANIKENNINSKLSRYFVNCRINHNDYLRFEVLALLMAMAAREGSLGGEIKDIHLLETIKYKGYNNKSMISMTFAVPNNFNL